MPAALNKPSARLRIWLSQTLAIFLKDVRIETNTGQIVVVAGFFALLVVILTSLAFWGGAASARSIAAGTIWLAVAFASVLALGKTWQLEREESALDGLLLLPLQPGCLFVGKALSILAFLCAIEIAVVPLAALFFAFDLWRHGPGIAMISVCALPGVACAGTLFGAMTVRTAARDLLLAVVLFPLLAPTLLAATVATRELLAGTPYSELRDYLLIMGVFDLVFGVFGLTFFDALLER